MSQNDFLKDLFIIDGVRTPIANPFKGLKSFTAAKLGAVVIKEVLARNQIKNEWVDQVIFGNTVSAGAGQNLARHASIFAGLPVQIPAFSVNAVCGSGLQAVIFASQAIGCREAGLIVAGGTESASHSPFLTEKRNKEETPQEKPLDSLINDGLWCHITNKHMGELAEHIAEEFSISRKEQDQFALESHAKAYRAIEQKKFKSEIIPVKSDEGVTVSEDDRPRKNISLERLSNLPPAFKENGTVTAGNCCAPCDGAAAVLLGSADFIKSHKLKPRARILSYASIAVEPEEVFTSSIYSTEQCLKKAGLKASDIDLFEIGEAFAVQALLTQKKIGIPDDKLNIYGGDVALGHPLGTAGIRILVTLMHALMNEKKRKGLASICLGGGGSVALAIENIA